MRSLLLFLLLGICAHLSIAQKSDASDNAIPNVVDSLYREDQFYIGLSFNLITNQPKSFSQNGFSGGLHAGFIRDMPINKRRNVAIGVGLGVSTNTYNSNLFIGQDVNEQSIYRILDSSIDVDRNRFNTNLIEMPIQFRWRTSTPTEYTFWRIYTGIKLAYIYHYKATFKSESLNASQSNIPEVNRFQYAATLSLGHGSFNAFVQYNLSTLFNEDAFTDIEQVNLQPIKFGIEFYIL